MRLTSRQRIYVRKHTRVVDPDPSEVSEELNIIPLLDILVNLIMFLLMSLTTVAFFAQVEATLPAYRQGGVGARSTEQQLNLNVTVTAEGVIVTGSGGKLAPGCETTAIGRVITVPVKSPGEYDWNKLNACIARVKSQFPNEKKVTVSADPLVEFQYVVSAMDAVRVEGSKELFPQVFLSAGVR
ncbi:MAG: biopolymer transporter ExbD [Myxococcales bacterium]|nr:biopolymer transporter ExbD [Myxococcales bacterium]